MVSSTRAQDSTTPFDGLSLRCVLVGLLCGCIICFSNLYFGLQAGIVNTMILPSTLIGFILFKIFATKLKTSFTPSENVVIQTVASSLGGMPLTAGYVGAIPALEYLTNSQDNGPLKFSNASLIVWSMGLCLFGVIFAVPLRTYFIIRQKLRFPSGTAAATLLGVLHNRQEIRIKVERDQQNTQSRLRAAENKKSKIKISDSHRDSPQSSEAQSGDHEGDVDPENHSNRLWTQSVHEILISFSTSAAFVSIRLCFLVMKKITKKSQTLVSYFAPIIRKLPLFGPTAANKWLWTLNLEPGYVGYGMIMAPVTTANILLGAILGWGILSPLAKKNGWAPGPVGDWNDGSQGWVIWVSLAIVLGDSVVSLSWLLLQAICQVTYGTKPAKRGQTGNLQIIL